MCLFDVVHGIVLVWTWFKFHHVSLYFSWQYIVFMVLVIILEIVAGVLGFVYQMQVVSVYFTLSILSALADTVFVLCRGVLLLYKSLMLLMTTMVR